MSLLLASLARASAAALRLPSPSNATRILVRGKNTKVRIIAVQDLPNGKAYRNDILEVAAGYARNYLIPQKFAVYATRQNFMKYELKDPELETVEERRLRLELEASQKENQDLKAADLLKHYLRNKTLMLLRRVDPDDSDGMALSPSHVDAVMVRKKLSKQLKIDLEEHEKVHLRLKPIDETVGEDGKVKPLESYMNEFGDPEEECTVKIKRLGRYVARISLSGGYSIPLGIEISKR